MRNQILFFTGMMILVILGIFLFSYEGKPAIPTVEADGKISGNYAIEGVMRLGKSYVCIFDKTDGSSKIAGVIHTDGQKIYGEFRIKTDLVKNEFNSFLIVKNGEAYTWTSLSNLGYQTLAAKSATKNASPRDQAQIVGLRDKIDYKCEPWVSTDNSIFEIPSWITFTNLK